MRGPIERGVRRQREAGQGRRGGFDRVVKLHEGGCDKPTQKGVRTNLVKLKPEKWLSKSRKGKGIREEERDWGGKQRSWGECLIRTHTQPLSTVRK